jgi:hypothetical protein
VNFRNRFCSLIGYAVVAACLMAIGGIIATVAHAGDYPMVTALIPAYGAGAAQSLSDPPPPEVQPEWSKRLEAKVDKMLKLLEELDASPGDTAPPAAAANAQVPEADLFFRADLSAAERERVAKKVANGSMPPKDAEPLAAEEKAAMVAAFRGQKFDQDALGSAGAKCMGCHGPAVAAKKGDGFQLFSQRNAAI